ncbi:Transposase IS200 like protein [Sporomusa ovata DSM 2662]|uniref:Transposase and inactivated derivatives n=1 Tax=Sporomusa ovata TaxID=2378 RepID=A0A0U1KWX0_9FIRM|nr:transposase [Sporomusa ovata]EQB28792.1 transposase IS200-family protein [Sporomusa ovata DSM 2662]CQR71950.1 Transposase and inactivated derivatives [Sporomusa ovata]
MPRIARKKSKSGIYHVIVRGINRQDIFHEEEDYTKYLEGLKRAQDISKFEIYGYCLMSNHVHLLLHEKIESMESIMKRVGVSYASWYNKKQERVGHVFQDRYKSEPIDSDAYLLSVLRYIHNNPVNAQLVLQAEDYMWSSCRKYSDSNKYLGDMVNTGFILKIFDECGEIAQQRWQVFMKQDSNDKFLDIEEKQQKIKDERLYEEIQKILKGQSLGELQSMEKASRDKIIRKIKSIEGVTQRQIARVTGINQSLVFKA